MRYELVWQPRGAIKLIRRASTGCRSMGLYRCSCGVEKWCRFDSHPQCFKTCSCPPRRYSKETKRCSRCSKRKPVSDFFTDRRTCNPRHQCNACHAEQSASWRERNPERALVTAREANRRIHSQVRFGLTREEYESKIASFGDVCGICGEKESRKTGRRSLLTTVIEQRRSAARCAAAAI